MIARIGAIIAPFIKDINDLTSLALAMMSLYAVFSIINVLFITFLLKTKEIEVPDTLMESENIGMKNNNAIQKKKDDKNKSNEDQLI